MKYVMYGKGIVGNAMVKLLEYMNYDFARMDDNDKDESILNQADKIIITAGISPKHEVYSKYAEKLMGELDLCWQVLKENNLLYRVNFYCITGTNGKSTTTWVLYNVLKELFGERARRPRGEKAKTVEHVVKICGNFEPAVSEAVLEICRRDVLLTRLQDNELVHPQDLTQPQDNDEAMYHLVTEISSFMCYQIKEFQSTDSIITNLAPDHLNWHSDLDDYRTAKIRLFQYTKNNCITSTSVSHYIQEKGIDNLKIQLYDHKSISLEKTNFIGKHNGENLAAVYLLTQEIAKRHGLDRNDELFYEYMKNIEPLGNRCKKSAVVDGIQFIDDLHATGTHAQTAALSCVEGELVLMCGGFQSGEDYEVMLGQYRNKVKAAVIIAKEPVPFSPLFDELGISYIHTQDMAEGVRQAINYAKQYNLKTVLYSPGAKSFDLFKNREERAKTFEEKLQKIVSM